MWEISLDESMIKEHVECEASQHSKVLKTNTIEVKDSRIALRLITSIKGILTPSWMVVGCVLTERRHRVEHHKQELDSSDNDTIVHALPTFSQRGLAARFLSQTQECQMSDSEFW